MSAPASSPARPWAAACALLLALLGAVTLSGCLASTNEIEFTTGSIGRAYARGQIISAMQNAGYRQVRFKSFETKGEYTLNRRANDEVEMRFIREGSTTFVVAVKFFMETSRAWLQLSENGQRSLSNKGEAELELIRQSLRTQFGPSVI